MQEAEIEMVGFHNAGHLDDDGHLDDAGHLDDDGHLDDANGSPASIAFLHS